MKRLRICVFCALSLASACTSKQGPAPTAEPEPVGCTKDAKVCPDGSTVGRSPPDCEFDPCPTEPVDE